MPEGRRVRPQTPLEKGVHFTTMCPPEGKAFIWEHTELLEKTRRQNSADAALYPEFRKELLKGPGGGRGVFNGINIINTLGIPAGTKAFRTELCFYKSQVSPSTFLICLWLIRPAKRIPSGTESPPEQIYRMSPGRTEPGPRGPAQPDCLTMLHREAPARSSELKE